MGGNLVNKALVLGGANNLFDVELSNGSSLLCSIKGKILKEAEGYYNPLAPGDLVEIEIDEHDPTRGQILSLYPRINHFVRWNQKGKAPQLLASNLDLLVIVTSASEPPFRPRFVDRALIQAEAEHITPLIVLNKCDLDTDPDIDERLEDWVRIGYKVLRVSAHTKEGLEDLASAIANKTSAFVGQSGVGKSTLLNALEPTLALKTSEISEKYNRGTHTTTRGNLYHIELGSAQKKASIIDTPGVRRFVLHDIPKEDLALYFPEMEPLVGRCSFGMSCSHEHEPGCKILEAVHAGVVHEDRYASWLFIKNELDNETWSN